MGKHDRWNHVPDVAPQGDDVLPPDGEADDLPPWKAEECDDDSPPWSGEPWKAD